MFVFQQVLIGPHRGFIARGLLDHRTDRNAGFDRHGSAFGVDQMDQKVLAIRHPAVRREDRIDAAGDNDAGAGALDIDHPQAELVIARHHEGDLRTVRRPAGAGNAGIGRQLDRAFGAGFQIDQGEADNAARTVATVQRGIQAQTGKTLHRAGQFGNRWQGLAMHQQQRVPGRRQRGPG